MKTKSDVKEVDEFTSKLYNKDLDRNKYTVCMQLRDREVPMAKVSVSVEEYLDSLRESIDKIAEITEEIKILP